MEDNVSKEQKPYDEVAKLKELLRRAAGYLMSPGDCRFSADAVRIEQLRKEIYEAI